MERRTCETGCSSEIIESNRSSTTWIWKGGNRMACGQKKEGKKEAPKKEEKKGKK